MKDMDNKIEVKPLKELTDEAHTRYSKIVSMRKDINVRFWVLVKELKEVRINKDWELLGWDSWAAYLGQPEVDLSVSTADHYITVLNKFDELGLLKPATVEISKLQTIVPHLTKENAIELLEKVKTLSRSDLRAEFGEEKDHRHKIIKCPKCGWEF